MREKLGILLFVVTMLFLGSFTSSQMVSAEISFSLKFGSSGIGDGKFNTPSGLTVDSANRIIVADTDNNRIQIFDSTGSYLDSFGSFGSANGKFDLPQDVAVDSADRIIVADTDNNRIQIFDSTGSHLPSFGSFGSTDGQFDLPQGVAVDSANRIIVADTDNNRIQIFNFAGSHLHSFGSFGSTNGKFDLPQGVAVDSANRIIVADTDNNRIQIFDSTGSHLQSFGSFGSTNGKFDLPQGVAVDSANRIIVADTDNNRIQIFDSTGSYLDSFGSLGSANGKFDLPQGVAVDSQDKILIADSDNNRIQVIELSGSSGGSSSESSSGSPSKPTGLKASSISTTSIFLSWDIADSDSNITGYKIESKTGSGSFKTIVENTGSNGNSFVHGGLSDGETYQYKIAAINSKGTSSDSSIASGKPKESLAPTAFTATAISPSKIKLTWFPPTSIFGSVTGYIVERVHGSGAEVEIGTTGSGTTSFTVSGLETDKQYTYVVKAKFSSGAGSPRSDTASATPKDDSYEPASSSISTPSAPGLTVKVISDTQIDLSWNKPSDGGSSISGYKIEFKEANGEYKIIDDNEGTSTTYSHTDLTPDKKYTYKVSAINGVGVGSSSSEQSGVPTNAPTEVLEIKPLRPFATNEEKRLTFKVETTETVSNVSFSLASNAPSGASIGSSSGSFTWTPTNTQSGTYTFDIIAKSGTMQDTETITITVNKIADKTQEPTDEPKKPETPKELGIASFVDPNKDPQHYVDRYNNESTYKKWFDDNFPEYDSIQQAVGLEEEKGTAVFVDPNKDPQSYVDRYNNESTYKKWFDDNFPEYDSIYQAVGLEEPKIVEPTIGNCGEGTELVNGVCTLVDKPKGGGCLIATAAYGSEMAPQVQFLREIRDNKVMSTEYGTSFMTGFNQFYYSFSPIIADYERENPLFKEVVKIGLTPMLSSLAILSVVDVNSEHEMLGYGIAIIMANIGMYFVAPAMAVYGIKKSKLVRF